MKYPFFDFDFSNYLLTLTYHKKFPLKAPRHHIKINKDRNLQHFAQQVLVADEFFLLFLPHFNVMNELDNLQIS